MKKTLQGPPEKPVATWIMIGVGMLVIQILLGGITRLTGSGLSITEWDVVTGALPPLNQQQWLAAFHKYQQTTQYRLLNFDFTLGDFKSIFFWEWFHRLWGRLIAVAFAVPFVIFLVRRSFRPSMIRPLLILFLLGALQGAVGWIMVASGLTDDAIYVKPAKLAMHFVLACLLISYAFWFGLQLLVREDSLVRDKGLRRFTWCILVLLIVQLVFGALMAGHKAAPAAPTWPDINGSFAPAYVFNRPEGWISIVENPVVIHFIHRSLAYLILVLIVTWTWRARRTPASAAFARWRMIPGILALMQVLLGISTVLTSVRIRAARWNIFEWMAQLHQLVAIFLLLSIVGALFFVRGRQKARSHIFLEPEPVL